MPGEPDYSNRAPDRDSRREQVREPPKRPRTPDSSYEPVRCEEWERPGPAGSDRQSIEAAPDGVVESPGGGGDA